MAPVGFQHSDWWSVLTIGCILAGRMVPWYHDIADFDDEASIDREKLGALFGRGWKKTVESLKQAQAKSSAWLCNSITDAKNAWVRKAGLPQLFEILLDAEIEYMQTGRTVEWRRAAPGKILAACGSIF